MYASLLILKLYYRYLNIYVGTPDVEESFNVTRPVSPHEVLMFASILLSFFILGMSWIIAACNFEYVHVLFGSALHSTITIK